MEEELPPPFFYQLLQNPNTGLTSEHLHEGFTRPALTVETFKSRNESESESVTRGIKLNQRH